MAQRGRDILIQIGDGLSPGTFTTVGGIRSRSVAVNNELIDITNSESQDYRELKQGGYGTRTCSISGAGAFLNDAVTRDLEDAAYSRAVMTMRAVYENGDYIEGDFRITNFTYAGELNGVQTYSVSIESAAAFWLVHVPPTPPQYNHHWLVGGTGSQVGRSSIYYASDPSGPWSEGDVSAPRIQSKLVFGHGRWMGIGASPSGTLYYTTDVSGATGWASLTLPSAFNVWDIWHDAVSNVTIVVGQGRYLARSTDGVNWTKITLPVVSSFDHLYEVMYGLGVWLACGTVVVYRSTDGGLSWTGFGPGLGGLTPFVLGFDEISNAFYLGFEWGDILRSGNLGVSWSQVYDPPITHACIVGASHGGRSVIIFNNGTTGTPYTLYSDNAFTSYLGGTYPTGYLPNSSGGQLTYGNAKFATASGAYAVVSADNGVTWQPFQITDIPLVARGIGYYAELVS